jgi:hypothetical protein
MVPTCAEAVLESLPLKSVKPNAPGAVVKGIPEREIPKFSGGEIDAPKFAVIVAEPRRLADPPTTIKVASEKVTVRVLLPSVIV